MMPARGEACSCTWKGPFMVVAKEAPLVIRGKILRHHPGPGTRHGCSGAGNPGGRDSRFGTGGSDGGRHALPPSDGRFSPGQRMDPGVERSGAKPGDGLALSHCGEFWLRVDDDDVVGSIDGDQQQVKRMPLSEFRNRFHYPRFNEKISGSIQSGKKFRQPFGPCFEFILSPTPTGWEILIREFGRDENLARLTPPLHFAPNPREIEGWHLSDTPLDCQKRPYDAETGPENPRKFFFSPEVGKSIDGVGPIHKC